MKLADVSLFHRYRHATAPGLGPPTRDGEGGDWEGSPPFGEGYVPLVEDSAEATYAPLCSDRTSLVGILVGVLLDGAQIAGRIGRTDLLVVGEGVSLNSSLHH